MNNEKKITLDDLYKQMYESSALFKEQMQAAEQERIVSNAAFDKRMQEAEQERIASNADFDERIKKLAKMVGGISNNQGAVAEELFYNTLEDKKEFAGIKFDEISNEFGGHIGKVQDQFDIVLLNGNTVGLIEVKYKIHPDEVLNIAAQKPSNFRYLFPYYKDYRIVIGIASLNFSKESIDNAKNLGIGIVRFKGESFEVDTSNIKFY